MIERKIKTTIKGVINPKTRPLPLHDFLCDWKMLPPTPWQYQVFDKWWSLCFKPSIITYVCDKNPEFSSAWNLCHIPVPYSQGHSFHLGLLLPYAKRRTTRDRSCLFSNIKKMSVWKNDCVQAEGRECTRWANISMDLKVRKCLKNDRYMKKGHIQFRGTTTSHIWDKVSITIYNSSNGL